MISASDRSAVTDSTVASRPPLQAGLVAYRARPDGQMRPPQSIRRPDYVRDRLIQVALPRCGPAFGSQRPEQILKRAPKTSGRYSDPSSSGLNVFRAKRTQSRSTRKNLLVVFDRPPAPFDACGLGRRQGGGTQGHRFFATSRLFLLGFSFALIA